MDLDEEIDKCYRIEFLLEKTKHLDLSPETAHLYFLIKDESQKLDCDMNTINNLISRMKSSFDPNKVSENDKPIIIEKENIYKEIEKKEIKKREIKKTKKKETEEEIKKETKKESEKKKEKEKGFIDGLLDFVKIKEIEVEKGWRFPGTDERGKWTGPEPLSRTLLLFEIIQKLAKDDDDNKNVASTIKNWTDFGKHIKTLYPDVFTAYRTKKIISENENV